MPPSISSRMMALGTLALGALLCTVSAAAAPAPGSVPAPPGSASTSAGSAPSPSAAEPPCPPGAYCERVEPVPPPPAEPPGAPAETPPTADDYQQAPAPPVVPPEQPRPTSRAGNPEYEGLPNDPYLRDGPPDEPEYFEGEPVPVGYHVERAPNEGLLIASGVVLGLSYLPLLIMGVAAAESEDEDAAAYMVLAVPVAGPPLLALLADANETLMGVSLGLAGAQAAGFVLLGLAFVASSAELVPDDPNAPVATAHTPARRGPVWILPLASPTIAGIALGGSM